MCWNPFWKIIFVLFYLNLSFLKNKYVRTNIVKKVREISYLVIEIRMHLQNWLQPILNVQIPDMTQDKYK